MPHVADKAPPPTTFQTTLGPSVGTASDFWALAYCPELDELEQQRDPAHSAFTYVFRYQQAQRTFVTRYAKRLDAAYLQKNGTLLAAGNTEGYLEITTAGITEVALANVDGVFTSMWGFDDDHLFATGAANPFIFHRRRGTWLALPLPEGAEDVRAACGFSERDVYFVGPKGQVHHFDGQLVTRVRVPVRRWLTGIARLDAQRLCICGYQGSVLVGDPRGWRHLATNTTDALLAIATLGGELYYGAEGKVYASDGQRAPTIAFDFEATWLSSLDDGIVLSSYTDAKLYAAGKLVDLDVTV